MAKEGKIPEVKYAAHIALFDEIEQDWGKADSTEAAGKGIYAAYTKRGVTIGFNKGMKVFDMRSYATIFPYSVRRMQKIIWPVEKKGCNSFG